MGIVPQRPPLTISSSVSVHSPFSRHHHARIKFCLSWVALGELASRCCLRSSQVQMVASSKQEVNEISPHVFVRCHPPPLFVGRRKQAQQQWSPHMYEYHTITSVDAGKQTPHVFLVPVSLHRHSIRSVWATFGKQNTSSQDGRLYLRPVYMPLLESALPENVTSISDL